MTNNPIAVVMADLHFNINNIDVASTALSVAIDKANDLGVTLIIAGDLHDTKAIIAYLHSSAICFNSGITKREDNNCYYHSWDSN